RGRLCPGGHRLGHRRRRLLALPAGVTTAQPPLPPAAAVHDGDGLLLRSLRIRRAPPAAAPVGARTALVRADGRGAARGPRTLSPPLLARAPGCAVAAPELAGAHVRVGSAPRHGERLPGDGSRTDARAASGPPSAPDALLRARHARTRPARRAAGRPSRTMAQD